MRIKYLNKITDWTRVLNSARRTVGKEVTEKEPNDSWKAKMLLAEHSPIRLLEFDWSWEDIKQWVTVHLVRHHIGCEKFVRTQREDRNNSVDNRDLLPQGSLNTMDMTANAQSIINISRKRLCSQASPETRAAWKAVIAEIKTVEPILAEKCVPECLYRGFCPEMHPCGFSETKKYQEDLIKYRNTKY